LTAHIWDPLTGKDVVVLRGHTSYVAPVAFSPDGKSVVTGSDDGTARIWDASSGKEVSRFTVAPAEVFAAAFSPDGRYVVIGRNDDVVQLWDVLTGKEARQFVGHTDGVRTASHDHTARLWRIS
jgi:WD40 repeat protein